MVLELDHRDAVPVRQGAIDPSFAPYRGALGPERALAVVLAWFRVREAAGRDLALSVEDIYASGDRLAIRARPGTATVVDVVSVLAALGGDRSATGGADTLDGLRVALRRALACAQPRLRDDLAAEPTDVGVDLMSPDGELLSLYDAEFALACGMDGTRDAPKLVAWAASECGLHTNLVEVRMVIAVLAAHDCLDLSEPEQAPKRTVVASDDADFEEDLATVAAGAGTSVTPVALMDKLRELDKATKKKSEEPPELQTQPGDEKVVRKLVRQTASIPVAVPPDEDNEFSEDIATAIGSGQDFEAALKLSKQPDPRATPRGFQAAAEPPPSRTATPPMTMPQRTPARAWGPRAQTPSDSATLRPDVDLRPPAQPVEEPDPWAEVSQGEEPPDPAATLRAPPAPIPAAARRTPPRGYASDFLKQQPPTEVARRPEEAIETRIAPPPTASPHEAMTRIAAPPTSPHEAMTRIAAPPQSEIATRIAAAPASPHESPTRIAPDPRVPPAPEAVPTRVAPPPPGLKRAATPELELAPAPARVAMSPSTPPNTTLRPEPGQAGAVPPPARPTARGHDPTEPGPLIGKSGPTRREPIPSGLGRPPAVTLRPGADPDDPHDPALISTAISPSPVNSAATVVGAQALPSGIDPATTLVTGPPPQMTIPPQQNTLPPNVKLRPASKPPPPNPSEGRPSRVSKQMSVASAEAVPTLACGQCGTQNPPGYSFCLNCGGALQRPALPPAPARVSAPMPVARACTKCGSPFTPGMNFCGSCGAVMDAGRPSKQMPAADRPRYADDNVQFTVYRPRAIAPAKWYPMLAFAHLSERRADTPDAPDPIAEVQKQVRQVLGDAAGQFANVTQDSRAAVPADGELTFAADFEGIEVNPRTRTFRWTEDVHREEFRMRAPISLDGKTVRGSVTVWLGSFVLAEIPVAVKVAAAAPERDDQPAVTQARPYRKIFASYSHRDRHIVDEVTQLARALGDEYVRDWVHLRTGEVWNERLRRMIADADVFQLFWSRNSMHSKFCRDEWEYALSLGRPSFVRPTYWEEPIPQNPAENLPPPELVRLHFQRIAVARAPAASASFEDVHAFEAPAMLTPIAVSAPDIALPPAPPAAPPAPAYYAPPPDEIAAELAAARPRRTGLWIALILLLLLGGAAAAYYFLVYAA